MADTTATIDLAAARRERRSRDRQRAADEIRARNRPRQADLLSTPDFDCRPRPARVHAAGPAPVRWDPRRGAFVSAPAAADRWATFRRHPMGWGAVALLFALTAFTVASPVFEAMAGGIG